MTLATRAALAVDVMPLLSGRVVVGRVEASGVRAQLLRDAQGRRNTDDLAGPAAPASAPSKAEQKSAAGKPLDFDIDRVTLKDVHIKIDGCVGQSFLRSYAVMTSSSKDNDDIVAYYGVTKMF